MSMPNQDYDVSESSGCLPMMVWVIIMLLVMLLSVKCGCTAMFPKG